MKIQILIVTFFLYDTTSRKRQYTFGNRKKLNLISTFKKFSNVRAHTIYKFYYILVSSGRFLQ